MLQYAKRSRQFAHGVVGPDLESARRPAQVLEGCGYCPLSSGLAWGCWHSRGDPAFPGGARVRGLRSSRVSKGESAVAVMKKNPQEAVEAAEQADQAARRRDGAGAGDGHRQRARRRSEEQGGQETEERKIRQSREASESRKSRAASQRPRKPRRRPTRRPPSASAPDLAPSGARRRLMRPMPRAPDHDGCEKEAHRVRRRKKTASASVGLTPAETRDVRDRDARATRRGRRRGWRGRARDLPRAFGGTPVLFTALPVDRVEPTPIPARSVPAARETPDGRRRDARPVPGPHRRDPQDSAYWTPNGNHRLQALRKLGAKTITALLVPDPDVAFKILALNTEKAHNLKENRSRRSGWSARSRNRRPAGTSASSRSSSISPRS